MRVLQPTHGLPNCQADWYQRNSNFGGFRGIDKAVSSNLQFIKSSLDKILHRIQNFMKDFEKVSSFHILRELNKQADLMANKACLLPLGSFSSNGDSCIMRPIP